MGAPSKLGHFDCFGGTTTPYVPEVRRLQKYKIWVEGGPSVGDAKSLLAKKLS